MLIRQTINTLYKYTSGSFRNSNLISRFIITSSSSYFVVKVLPYVLIGYMLLFIFCSDLFINEPFTLSFNLFNIDSLVELITFILFIPYILMYLAVVCVYSLVRLYLTKSLRMQGLSEQLNYDLSYNIYNLETLLNFFNINLKNYYTTSHTYNLITDLYLNYIDYPLLVLFGIMFCITSFISLLAYSYLGLYGVFWLNALPLWLMWLSYFLYLPYFFSNNLTYYISFGKWMYLSPNYRINFDLYLDSLSIGFSFLTVSIASFVYIFTFSYFRYEPSVERLSVLLNMFVISMVFLVSSGNLITLFLGWEMIGLTSFFLINFWVTKVSTLKAAFKAFSFNKISDVLLFFGILLIFSSNYTLNIPSFLASCHTLIYSNVRFAFVEVPLAELIGLCFVGCSFIKSAQFGPHIWLPDSMEAPVPASALIHSATLVSAGVYVLSRFLPLLLYTPFSWNVVFLCGALTAFYGGYVSAHQSDTKRLLAYSTISHCGFLMVLVASSYLEYMLIYLYIHGFFKAAVFLCVGDINRFSKNNQDFKKMGMYYKFLPFDCLAAFIGIINLGGLPLTLGFYTKHLLLLNLHSNLYLYYIVLTLCTLASFSGVFYSYRLFYSVFFDFKKSRKQLYAHVLDKNLVSKHYSQVTFASIVSIVGLMGVAYLICFLFLYYFSSFSSHTSDLQIYAITNLHLNNIFSNSNYLLNSSLLNTTILLFVVTLIYTPWRTLVTRAQYINSFSYVVGIGLIYWVIYSHCL